MLMSLCIFNQRYFELNSLRKIPNYGSLTVISYPGKATILSTINKTKSEHILKRMKRLKIVSPNIQSGFKEHGIRILCPGRYSIFMRSNLVVYKTGRISSVYNDPKRRIEKIIIKDIATQSFKEIVDYTSISEKINLQKQQG